MRMTRGRVTSVGVAMRMARVSVACVPVTLAVRGVAVTRVRRVCETAQSHDAEANSAKRQTERVGVHGVV